MSVKLSAASLSMTCVHVDIYNRMCTALVSLVASDNMYENSLD